MKILTYLLLFRFETQISSWPLFWIESHFVRRLIMNSLLSKRLLFGVIATSFFLINCQKAPNRSVKPETGVSGKQQAVVADCSDNVKKLREERNIIAEDLTRILA